MKTTGEAECTFAYAWQSRSARFIRRLATVQKPSRICGATSESRVSAAVAPHVRDNACEMRTTDLQKKPPLRWHKFSA